MATHTGHGATVGMSGQPPPSVVGQTIQPIMSGLVVSGLAPFQLSGSSVYATGTPMPGGLGSGSVRSGYVFGTITSGSIGSGYGTITSGSIGGFPMSGMDCRGCGVSLTTGGPYTPFGWNPVPHVKVLTPDGQRYDYCLACAGYQSGHRFRPPEHWIRSALPLDPDTPAGIVADYLRDQKCDEAADEMLRVARRFLEEEAGG